MVVRAVDDIVNDIMVLIVEVKLGRVVLWITIEQLMDYLLSMQKKINQDPSDLFLTEISGVCWSWITTSTVCV